jgi:hypothetical protein
VNLYQQTKSLLPAVKAAISDEELLILNRKDYHQSQISGVNAWINELGIKIGYPYRLLLSLIEQISSGSVDGDFNVVLCDPSLTVAALYSWVKSGGSPDYGSIYAPNGVAQIPHRGSLVGELVDEFFAKVDRRPEAKPSHNRAALFTFVIGNTKSAAQTTFAADRFFEVESGFMVLKDYARVDAADEREYLESKLIFPSITLEGHAYALKRGGRREA